MSDSPTAGTTRDPTSRGGRADAACGDASGAGAGLDAVDAAGEGAAHPLRVVLFTKGSPWGEWAGGGQVFAHGLATALSSAGHRVAAVYTYQKERPVAPATPYAIEWAAWGRLGWSFVSVPRAIAAAARAIDAQLVLGLGEEMILAGGPARPGGVAWAMGAHHPMFYPIGLKLDFQRGLLFNHYQIRMYILHETLRRAPAVIVPSAYAARRLVEIVGTRAERVRVVPNGIDEAFFAIRRSLEPADPPQLLFVGRLEPQKGVDLLLAALPAVLATHPGLVLRCLGPSTAFEPEYRRTVQRMGIEGHVRFEGWQSPAMVREALATCRACVLPSRYESFGLAAVEAMAAGAPLVTTRTGALADLVEDGRTGFLAALDDASDLARAILAALADPAASAAAGARARDAAQPYRWSSVASQYARAFRDIVAAQAGSATRGATGGAR